MKKTFKGLHIKIIPMQTLKLSFLCILRQEIQVLNIKPRLLK